MPCKGPQGVPGILGVRGLDGPVGRRVSVLGHELGVFIYEIPLPRLYQISDDYYNSHLI